MKTNYILTAFENIKITNKIIKIIFKIYIAKIFCTRNGNFYINYINLFQWLQPQLKMP